jgi:Na+/H+ antiporter NhaD/arsenite permease-like protein
MMPVHKLPDASWRVALGLGFVSAVFDNIPLTALALTDKAVAGRERPTTAMLRYVRCGAKPHHGLSGP